MPTVAFAGGAPAGAAAPDRHAVRARLVDHNYQRTYDLAGTHITMGRETGNDIVVQDINASRKHAELRYEDDGSWSIIDLNSMNGTQVNGRRIGSARLNGGDRITIGITDFVFMYE